MRDEKDKPRQVPEPETRPPEAPGAPTVPAEAHRETPPEVVECMACRVQIPADAAEVPEGLDYVLYFCSPGCHEAWEKARGEEGGNAQEEAQRPVPPGKG